MSTFIVTRKTDGTEVYRYQAEAPIEWNGWEFATHDHTLLAPTETPAAGGWEILDAIDYLKLLTPAERIAIREAAKSDHVVEDIVDLQRNAPRIRSDDPNLLQALDYLTATGILAVGRKQEILNG